MAYGKLKADTLVWDNSGADTELALGDIPPKASPTFTGTVNANTAVQYVCLASFIDAFFIVMKTSIR